MYEIVILVWWSVFVVSIAVFHNSLGEYERPVDAAYLMVLCLTWPISIWFLLIALFYTGTVRSADKIRQDYRNAKIDHAFREWYDKIGKTLYPPIEKK